MTRNVGIFDRVVRVLLGLALVSLFFGGPKTWIGLIGVVPLLTAAFGYCPLYRALGIRTCAAQSA